ncbi:WG repeat-containing protein [Lacinutrix sp. 5H-3-7-4]|uniref:WG repeat-containing protein n=1 Tax=Lacinutrix sp. (strain 5H-3-7-4) TaxID=983544 RepID=UPI00020A3DA1|nr:WG repeat-containing protein [Lacinutrix sp. 5H-3-7-4]AEH01914.1 KWG Leptospira repeat protein [Lacinutrix sp. 5H-3-7-4]
MNSRTFKITLLTVLLSFSFVFAQKLALANQEGKFGYINKTGEFKIKPKFKNAKNFSEDVAQASIDGKLWGYINRQGEWVVQPKFKKSKAFNSGIAMAVLNKNWIYINTKGEQVLSDLKTDKIYDFSEGLAIYRENDKVGFINTKGDIVIKPKYKKAFPFLDGYSKVLEGDKWGVIDKNGNYYIKTEYDGVSKVYNNLVTAKKGEQNGLIVNGTFKAVDGAEKVWDFSVNPEIAYAKKDGKIGFINKNGDWIVEPQFDKVRAFVNGLAPVLKNKKWGYIDTSGTLVIPHQYRDAEIFSKDGLAPVKLNKFWGFIDKTGKLVIEDRYAITAGGFSIFKKNNQKGFIDGLARVKDKKTWVYINTKGEVLNNTNYKHLELFN